MPGAEAPPTPPAKPPTHAPGWPATPDEGDLWKRSQTGVAPLKRKR